MLFKVQLWHLLTMASLLVWSVWLTIHNYSIASDLNGDVIMIALTGCALTFFGWRFYVQRS